MTDDKNGHFFDELYDELSMIKRSSGLKHIKCDNEKEETVPYCCVLTHNNGLTENSYNNIIIDKITNR